MVAVKIGVVGVGAVGSATTLSLLAREIVLVDRVQEIREQVATEIRYANISIIEGIGASQYGIGAVSARLAEAVPRDEQGVFTVAAYRHEHKVTLSLLSVLGRTGVTQMHHPRMTEAEQVALEASARTLRRAVERILRFPTRRTTRGGRTSNLLNRGGALGVPVPGRPVPPPRRTAANRSAAHPTARRCRTRTRSPDRSAPPPTDRPVPAVSPCWRRR
jgi:malate/lactate dehydrogenase